MEDQEFARRIKAKIERLAGTDITLEVDDSDSQRLKVDLGLPVPAVTLGSSIYEYAGFARMAVEYAVASIRQRRELGRLEFFALLERN